MNLQSVSPEPVESRPPVVELCAVTKTFLVPNVAPTTAVSEVTLTVEDAPGWGEFVVLLGPSGCGKSTLLNLIAGLSFPTSGEVKVGGKKVTGPGSDRGFVFQNYSSLPWRTVRQNVELGLELARSEMPALDRRTYADSLLYEVGLLDKRDLYPRQLSGGMRQRLALARTLAVQPNIILMDEPFGALDVRIRIEMQDLLHRMWQRAESTVLFVTHDVAEAVYLADTIVILSPSPGRIAETLRVDFPHPRDRSIEKTPQFRELTEYITGKLRTLARSEAKEPLR